MRQGRPPRNNTDVLSSVYRYYTQPHTHIHTICVQVRLLTDFSGYESESVMLRSGGLALLPLKLSWVLRYAA